MPPRIELSSGSYRRIILTRFGPDGTTEIANAAAAFTDNKHYTEAAKKLKASPDDVRAWVGRFKSAGHPVLSIELAEPSTVVKTAAVRVRGIRQASADGRPVPSFAEALDVRDYPHDDPIIVWDDREAIAAVDLDFHTSSPPNTSDLDNAAQKTTPRPRWYWITKSGGLRLIYEAIPPYTAAELAAVGALYLKLLFPLARVEIKTDTRHPAYAVGGKSCGPVVSCTPNADCGFLGSLSGEGSVDESEITEWLELRGMARGGRYAHTHCPIDPRTTSGDSRKPVYVGDHGILCPVCEANGKTYRSRRAGFFSFAALIRPPAATLLKSCIDNLTHWEHARFIVNEVIRDERISRDVYGAALKLRHGSDPRLARAFTAGTDLVRFDNHWATVGGQAYKTSRMRFAHLLAELPACQSVDTVSGELSVNEIAIAKFEQPIDLAPYGYPSLTTIWGTRIWSQYLDLPKNKAYVLMHTSKYRHEAARDVRPQYVGERARMPEAEAWETLERAFPRINRNAVKLLIAAKGCAEGRVGMSPFVFFSGPSGAGKTAIAAVAAAICGDCVSTVTWSPQAERVRAGLLAAKECGGFALFDEFVKHSRGGRKGVSDSMEMLLTFTEDSVSHKLYVGPVPLGMLPVCVWADTTVPDEIVQHTQIARRLIHVYLPERMSWEVSLTSSRVGKPEEVRFAGPDYVSACNSILSAVVDQFFLSERTFTDIAEELGFQRLEDSDLAREKESAIRELFDAVCQAPPIVDGALLRRFGKGDGWKEINLDSRTPLREAWLALADRNGQDSRAVNECDLKLVLGLKCTARCRVQANGRTLAIRFMSDDGTLINEALRDVATTTVQLVAESPDVLRLRDAIGDQPPNGGEQSLPAGLLDSFDVGGRQDG